MSQSACKSPEDLPLILRINDLMRVLDIGRNTAYDLVRSGRIYSVRIGNQIRIPKQAVLAFLETPATSVGA